MFTIQDIKKWLGCSDQHGEIVWARSGLFVKIIDVCSKKFAKKCSDKSLDELRALACQELPEIFIRLKQGNQKYNFSSIKQFYEYLHISLDGCLQNICFTQQKEISLDEITNLSASETELTKLSMHEIEKKAARLVQKFLEWLDRPQKKSYKEYVELFFNIDINPINTAIVAFIECNEFSEMFWNYFYNKHQMKRTTYDVKNKRLRNQWQNFLKTHDGRLLYSQLKDFEPRY